MIAGMPGGFTPELRKAFAGIAVLVAEAMAGGPGSHRRAASARRLPARRGSP